MTDKLSAQSLTSALAILRDKTSAAGAVCWKGYKLHPARKAEVSDECMESDLKKVVKKRKSETAKIQPTKPKKKTAEVLLKGAEHFLLEREFSILASIPKAKEIVTKSSTN